MKAMDTSYRDWWQRNANADGTCVVSSVAVSSTGWPSVSQAHSAQCGSSSGTSVTDWSHVSGAELCNQRSFKDLQDFTNAFSEPMLQAKACFEKVDEHLVEGLEHVVAEAMGLVNSAASVTTSIFHAASECREYVPSLSYSTNAEGNVHALAHVLDVLKKPRKEAQNVRAGYINLLDQVGYLGQCAEIRMDESVMSELENPKQDADGNYIDTLPDVTLLSQDHRCLENTMRMALVHLDRACSVLEDCPEFWLMLHKAELSLLKLEKRASKLIILRRPALSNSRAQELAVLAKELGDFCKGQLGNPVLVNGLAEMELLTRQ